MRKNMQNTKTSCTATVGSLTQTIHAQQLLANAAIRAEVIRADSAQARRGCAYALSFACSQEGAVHQILRAAGVRAHR